LQEKEKLEKRVKLTERKLEKLNEMDEDVSGPYHCEIISKIRLHTEDLTPRTVTKLSGNPKGDPARAAPS